jgi:hypothetical protein
MGEVINLDAARRRRSEQSPRQLGQPTRLAMSMVVAIKTQAQESVAIEISISAEAE